MHKFTLERYQIFLELQEKYETEKAQWDNHISPIIDQYRWSKQTPEQTHRGSLGSELNYYTKTVSYEVSCCGSSDYDSLPIKDLLGKEWLEKLEIAVKEREAKKAAYNEEERIKRKAELEHELNRLK